MYRLAPSRCARRPKQPANRSRNLPSRSSTARAVDTDKSTAQHTKLLQKSTVRIIGSLVRKNGSDKVLLVERERELARSRPSQEAVRTTGLGVYGLARCAAVSIALLSFVSSSVATLVTAGFSN